MKKLDVHSITTITQNCIWYAKGTITSLLPTFIKVIDDENISTGVLEKLELQFNMLYELQNDFGADDEVFDRKVIKKAGIVAKQIIRILEDNKN